MKAIDKILRFWRVEVARREAPKNLRAIFDIGCDDGYLLKKFAGAGIRLDGCDPRLEIGPVDVDSHLSKGSFPNVTDYPVDNIGYDAIFALAVFEHFSELDIHKSVSIIANMLSEKGLLIITVPDQFVDKILNVLLFFRLIDGQALEEHHEFDPNSLIILFSKKLHLRKKYKFQFGLNNVFVFEKKIITYTPENLS